jgi:hypothetical protein
MFSLFDTITQKAAPDLAPTVEDVCNTAQTPPILCNNELSNRFRGELPLVNGSDEVAMDCDGPASYAEPAAISEGMDIEDPRVDRSVADAHPLMENQSHSTPALSSSLLQTAALVVKKPAQPKQSSDRYSPKFTQFPWTKDNVWKKEHGAVFERARGFHVCVVEGCSWYVPAVGVGASEEAKKHVMAKHFGKTDEMEAGIKRLMDHWKTKGRYLRVSKDQVNKEVNEDEPIELE